MQTSLLADLAFSFGTGKRGKDEPDNRFTAVCCVLVGLTNDVMLGLPFLQKENPVIDWESSTMRFPRTNLLVHAHSAARPRISLCSIQQMHDLLHSEGT